MAIMVIQEFDVEEDDRSTPNYDSISERINIHADPAPGLICHTAGFTGRGQFRIAAVWESEGAWASFRDGRLAEALEPMRASGEGSPPAAEYSYELHDLIKP
jgi:hypothetical protein